MSPWVSFSTDDASFQYNAQKDILDAAPVIRWSTAFLGQKSPGDFYAEPRRADSSWWEGAADVAGDVLIWAGGSEVLVDGITDFAWTFAEGFNKGQGKGGSKKVKWCATAHEPHDGPIVDKLLGYKTKGKGARDIEEWLKSKL